MRTFGSVFRTPWKNPWTDIRETYGQLFPSEVLRSAIFGAKVLSAVSKITRLIKKIIKRVKYNSLPYRYTPELAAVNMRITRFTYPTLFPADNVKC